MEAIEWIPFFLISGLCTSPLISAQYRQHCLVETPKNWSAAQSHCREKGFDLATIDDMGAMEALRPLFGNQVYVWIGIRPGGPFNWYWSLADNHYYKEGERNYRNFRLGGNKSYLAVLSTADGMWSSLSTKYRRYFVCYDADKQGGDRYVLVRNRLNWPWAREHCRRYYTDLVSIRNAAENQVVREVAAGYEVWIGLFKDPWRWSDGRYSSFRFWMPNTFIATNNTNYCGAVIQPSTGRWWYINCAQLRPFICSCTTTRVFKVKVRSADLPDLNDPATQEAILQQMQQLVEDATSTGAHKLTWRTQPDGQVFTREQCQQEDCDSLN